MIHKIAVVTETWPPEINGVALTTEKMVLGFLAKGHQVDLYRPEQEKAYVKTKGLSEFFVGGITLPWYKEVRFGIPATRFLKKNWKQSRPDIVQIVTEGPLGFAAMRVAKSLGIPVISEFHTNFHQYSQYYHLGLLLKMANKYLRWFHNQSNLALVATKELKDSMHENGYKHLEVVSRGIDTNRFSPQKRSTQLRQQWGLSEDQLAIIHVGRLANEKNLGLAVSTFREIQKQQTNVKMIMVGDGPARETLAKENPDFIFSGMQTGEDLAIHYASGDLFLSPSTSETFGNVTLEAMASGLPIVCFDYAAAREHITNEVHGFSAPLNNNTLFTDMALRLAGSESLRNRLGDAATIKIQDISWNRVVDVFEKHMNRLILDSNSCTTGEVNQPEA